MPLSILLCEGVQDSPDARVLNKLLSGLCSGGANRLKVQDERANPASSQLNPVPVVMGLEGSTSIVNGTASSSVPAPWFAPIRGGRVERLGWLWSRKEIENYLIDPQVVERALGPIAPPLDRYLSILDCSARSFIGLHRSRVISPLETASSLAKSPTAGAGPEDPRTTPSLQTSDERLVGGKSGLSLRMPSVCDPGSKASASRLHLPVSAPLLGLRSLAW